MYNNQNGNVSLTKLRRNPEYNTCRQQIKKKGKKHINNYLAAYKVQNSTKVHVGLRIALIK